MRLINTFKALTLTTSLGVCNFLLIGCNVVYNNNLQISTAICKIVTGRRSVVSPLGSQPVAGQYVADIPLSSPLNTAGVALYGSLEPFQGVTLPYNQTTAFAGLLTDTWPTSFVVSDARMPAYWNFEWEHPSYCIDTSNTSYPPLANPAIYTNEIELPTKGVFFYAKRSTARLLLLYQQSRQSGFCTK